jgi:hypothetical protein
MTSQDAEHLRLLALFHYGVAGLQLLFALFPLIHFVVGAAMVFFPDKAAETKDGTPALIGMAFMGFAAVWIAVGLTVAVCTALAGRNLSRRRRYHFCIAVAAIETIACVPFGTILGVLTIIVLLRPAVKQEFEVAASPAF